MKFVEAIFYFKDGTILGPRGHQGIKFWAPGAPGEKNWAPPARPNFFSPGALGAHFFPPGALGAPGPFLEKNPLCGFSLCAFLGAYPRAPPWG